MNSTILKWAGLLTAASVFAAGAATAGPDNNKLVINGQELVTDVKAPEGSALDRV